MSRLLFRCRHQYSDGFLLDAQFETRAGVTALLGPSGSGKSSVLAMIAGVLRPHTGLISLGDRVLFDAVAGVHLPPEKRRIGVVFQEHLLFPHLSVEGNLKYGLKRRPSRNIEIGGVVQVLELGHLLRRSPQTLSGGERQRVALGRALLRGPELLLMDEPLAALDAELKNRILDYLARSFAEWRVPTLFVTHDESDAGRIASHTIVLNAGRVVRTTEPTESSSALRA